MRSKHFLAPCLRTSMHGAWQRHPSARSTLTSGGHPCGSGCALSHLVAPCGTAFGSLGTSLCTLQAGVQMRCAARVFVAIKILELLLGGQCRLSRSTVRTILCCAHHVLIYPYWLQGLLRLQRLLLGLSAVSDTLPLPLPRHSRKLIALPTYGAGQTSSEALQPKLGVPVDNAAREADTTSSKLYKISSAQGLQVSADKPVDKSAKVSLRRNVASLGVGSASQSGTGAADVGADQVDTEVASITAAMEQPLPTAGTSTGVRLTQDVPKTEQRMQKYTGQKPGAHPVAEQLARSLREGKASSHERHLERAQAAQQGGSNAPAVPAHVHDTDHDERVSRGPQWQFELDDRPVDGQLLRKIPREEQGVTVQEEEKLRVQRQSALEGAQGAVSVENVQGGIGQDDIALQGARQAAAGRAAWAAMHQEEMAKRAAAAAKAHEILLDNPSFADADS